MADQNGCLCDSNILLRLFRPQDQEHQLIRAAVESLLSSDLTLYFTIQNAAEFWNVCTRPGDRNGFGLSPEVAHQILTKIEEVMTLLPESPEAYLQWRELVLRHEVRGVQVHDARLVASMQANGLHRILTLNVADFERYGSIEALHPSHLLARP